MKALRTILDLVRCITTDRRGASAVEYGIIVGCIMLAIFAAVASMGGGLQHVLATLSTQLDTSTR